MTSEDKDPGFWTTLPGILTAIAGVVTAATGLLIALDQVGVIGSDSTSEDQSSTVAQATSQPPSGSVGAGDNGVGDALAGTWRGAVAGLEAAEPVEVVLAVEAPCHLREPCGTISVGSALCTGRVTLWTVRSQTYEFYVDQFTADSSSECTPGAGDFFELLDDETLRYTTDYSDAVGVLERAG